MRRYFLVRRVEINLGSPQAPINEVEKDEKVVVTDIEESGEEESDEEEDAEQKPTDDVKQEPDDDEEYTDLESNCSGLTDISGLSDIGEELLADEPPDGMIDAGLSSRKKKSKVPSSRR